ncbi:MAG: hypothetical protein J2P17_16285 [Mycobacterium sp.]|nr:hypothetical protein [Mycobacterium sp.]
MNLRINRVRNATPETQKDDDKNRDGRIRGRRRNGMACPRCKRFGTFSPNAIVCDRCVGALPLIFTITVTVAQIGGDR